MAKSKGYRGNNYNPNHKIKEQAVQEYKNKMKIQDGYQNVAARLGSRSDNIANMGTYITEYTTHNWTMLQSLYRNNWLATRVVDMKAEDMMKNWIDIYSTSIDADAETAFNHYIDKIRLREQILEGLKWGRLYGGALGIIRIKGEEDQLDQPLNLDTIQPGSFRGLTILDRWRGISPSVVMVDDIDSPDYDTPESYNISVPNIMEGVTVHHSRCIRFINGNLPYLERMVEQYWGISEVEKVMQIIERYDSTSANLSALMFSANLKVLKSENLTQNLATGNPRDEERFYASLNAMNQMMSNHRLTIIDKEDEFQNFSYSFGGLNDLYQSFMLDLAGALQIPVTKLFMRSPAGMNATGESDEQTYYEHINQIQKTDLKPILDKLLPILCHSIFNEMPEDIYYEFKSIRLPTLDEIKNEQRDAMTSIERAFSSGLLSHKQSLKMIQRLPDYKDIITDEDIENADNGYVNEELVKEMLGGEEDERTDIEEVRTEVSEAS